MPQPLAHHGVLQAATHLVCQAARRWLQRISGLSTFPNICHLDLSNNAIRSISNLSSLVALRKLVLTNNRIAKVEGLEGLLSLEHLLLQENMLQTLSSLNLPMLASLPCLSTVYLQNHDGKQVSLLRFLHNIHGRLA